MMNVLHTVLHIHFLAKSSRSTPVGHHVLEPPCDCIMRCAGMYVRFHGRRCCAGRIITQRGSPQSTERWNYLFGLVNHNDG